MSLMLYVARSSLRLTQLAHHLHHSVKPVGSRNFASMAAQVYDAIVIGSGQGGTPLCMALASNGMKTALVESTHLGGTCVNEGCMFALNRRCPS